jgi:hypothetical protein
MVAWRTWVKVAALGVALAPVAALLPGLPVPPAAGADGPGWKHELARDLVKVQGDTMVVEAYEVCTTDEASYQLHLRSQAPRDGGISRDNFVAFTVMARLAAESELGEADCKEVSAPIGEVDVRISIQMTGEGFRREYHDRRTGETDSSTVLWSDVFAR